MAILFKIVCPALLVEALFAYMLFIGLHPGSKSLAGTVGMLAHKFPAMLILNMLDLVWGRSEEGIAAFLIAIQFCAWSVLFSALYFLRSRLSSPTH